MSKSTFEQQVGELHAEHNNICDICKNISQEIKKLSKKIEELSVQHTTLDNHIKRNYVGITDINRKLTDYKK